MNEIEQKSESLLTQATVAGASDIHVIPRHGDALIRFRVDGMIVNHDVISRSFAQKLISHLKFLSGMDIGEKRRPQNGSLDTWIEQHAMSLRLSTLPTHLGESLVLRLLPQDQTLSMTELSLFPNVKDQLFSMMSQSHGFILLTGPTGSGKTTLLYALLNDAITRQDRQVITFEDPIEKKNDSFVQMEVNEKAGVTYLEGFRSILRHDPDIIMFGEIRDSETAKMAVQAALTGHLILSTMHTKDCVGTVFRLLELGISLSYLEQTLTGIVAQRLVELVCPYCGKSCHPQCHMRRKLRRLGVYEVLSGTSLHSVISSIRHPSKATVFPTFKKVKDIIKRGVAFGYLSENQTI